MTLPIEFSAAAERQLAAIRTWSTQEFGAQTARKYNRALISAALRFADPLVAPRRCASLTGEPAHDSLLFVRQGRHVLIARKRPTAIRVIAVLHQSENIIATMIDLTSKKDP